MSQFVNASNYLLLPRNTQKWLIEDLIPSQGLVNVFGKPKTGKSFTLLDMAAAIADPTQQDWNGFPIRHHGPVLYLQIDTPRVEWGERVEAMVKAGRDLSNVWFADLESIPHFPFDILDPGKANFNWLKSEVQRIQPVWTILDTMRDAHSGDENDATVMRNVILQIVAATRPGTTGFMSHQKKDTPFMKSGGDDIMDDNRGSSVVAGKMDNVIRLTKHTLAWEGRSGKGHISIMQDPNTGLIVLDKAAAQQALDVLLIVTREFRKDPSITKKKCAEVVQLELGWTTSLKTAERKVEVPLRTLGWKP